MGGLTTFFSFFIKLAILIGPSGILLELWACPPPPNRSTSLDPQLQNRNKRASLNATLLVYIRGGGRGELNFGQTIGVKTQVLLGTSWGTHLGTPWEFGNICHFNFWPLCENWWEVLVWPKSHHSHLIWPEWTCTHHPGYFFQILCDVAEVAIILKSDLAKFGHMY
jgi:hypothetical protein